MVASVPITQSVIANKRPLPAEVDVGVLAVNISDGALFSKRADGTIIRIEGDSGNDVIAGTSTINAIALRDGQTRTVRFTGASGLVHSAGLQLLGGANIATAAGDYATFRGYAAGVTKCVQHSFNRAIPAPYALPAAATDLPSVIALANSLRALALYHKLGV